MVARNGIGVANNDVELVRGACCANFTCVYASLIILDCGPRIRFN